MTWDQWWILLCSGTAAWLVACRDVRRRKWGFVVGLAGQPAWMWAAWSAGQWAIGLLTLYYAAMYARGIRSHFFTQE